MKIKLLLAALFAAITVPALAQTNCASVDWINNTNNPENLRLRIQYYANGDLTPLCNMDFLTIAPEGLVWDGTFPNAEIDSGGFARYYVNDDTIKGRKLGQGSCLYWDQSNSRWIMSILYDGKIAPYYAYVSHRILWQGYLSGTNPIGTYTGTASCDYFTNNPTTLTVECYQPSDSRCFVTLWTYPSPYHNSTDDPDCIATVGAKQWKDNGEDVTINTNLNGQFELTVEDGDWVEIFWPDCCDDGWAIMAQGPLMQVIDGGEPTMVRRVTLCLPNGNGVVPIDQITSLTDTNGGPGSLMKPPYSFLSLPVYTNRAFNGCVWQAHIKCVGCDPPYLTPYCDAAFELKLLLRCSPAVWVNQSNGNQPWAELGADGEELLPDLYIWPPTILHHTMGWPNRKHPFVKANSTVQHTTVDTDGLFYLWYNN